MTADTGPQAQALTGAEAYFLEVLMPNKRAFFEAPSTFVTALNLATALYHFHEWLFDEFKPQLEAELGMTFASKGAFWQAVQTSDPRFGYIRDLTNASKHVKIGGRGHPPPSTGMTHIANTHIVSTGYGQGGYGSRRYGGGPNVMFDDAGQQISFDDCATALYSYWKSLIEKMTRKIFL
ncbi:MAG: hypothetical protein WAK34_00155 [Rhodoplanes sp.]